MSLYRFFLDTQILADEADDTFRLDLTHEDEKHAKVVRLRPGEHIAIIDGASDYFECVIERIDADGVFVSITQHLDAPTLPFAVTLFQGLAKGERFDQVLKHCTELGVSAFVPLLTERTVVKVDPKRIPSKMERWATIIRNAAKQSGLAFIPALEAPVAIESALPYLHEADLVLICWEGALRSGSIRHAIAEAGLRRDAKVAIVVGPEGGLADDEVSRILGACPETCLVSLGPTILRTETAAVVSCALALDEMREELL